MHTKPIPETQGDLSTEKPIDRPCRRCGERTVVLQVWSSHDGAYDDEKYTCKNCGHHWWVEGPDA